MIPEYISDFTSVPDYHSVNTIQLCELIDAGFIDWTDESWKWDYYNEEQYERMCKKIEARYYYREINLVPPGIWKREFIRFMNEIMPKYKILYKKLDDGLEIFADIDRFGKSRNIYSDFPQTMLGENEDYASSGNDREFEDITLGNIIDTIDKFRDRYKDIDVLILDDLECLFSCFYTMNTNTY